MTQQHPLTPPPELVEEWIEIAKPEPWKRPPDPNVLCAMAAQWGADQELEACCEWIGAIDGKYGPRLRLARRPKPQSLKEQALQALELLIPFVDADDKRAEADTIRRALEQIDD